MMTTTDFELCPDPDLCRDPACESAAHLPDRDDDGWDDASWVEFDQRAERRADV